MTNKGPYDWADDEYFMDVAAEEAQEDRVEEEDREEREFQES